MKTVRIAAIATIAIILGASFASCNKDDNPVGGDFFKEKKLTKISVDDSYLSFTYDNKGRLIKAERNDGYKQTVKWEDDVIKTTDNVDYIYTLPLSNGLVQSIYYDDQEEEKALYNLSNRLFKWESGETQTKFVWDEDKLIRATYVEYGTTYENALTYDKSCKKGYFPLLHTIVDFETSLYILYTHPELFGLHTTQLPASHTCSYGNNKSYTETYSYEFDNEGYITKVTRTNDGEVLTYTLSWE